MANSCLTILITDKIFKKSLEGRKFIEKYEFQNIKTSWWVFINNLGLKIENRN